VDSDLFKYLISDLTKCWHIIYDDLTDIFFSYLVNIIRRPSESGESSSNVHVVCWMYNNFEHYGGARNIFGHGLHQVTLRLTPQ